MRSLLLAVLVTVVAAPTAHAGTLTLTSRFEPGYRGSGSWIETAVYTAAPGEVNDVELTVDPAQVTVRDAAGVVAGPGCEPRAADMAVCPRHDHASTLVGMTLGDGDDRAHSAYPSLTIDGGEGADRLDIDPASGPAAPQELRGGAGDDELIVPSGRADGGPGSDRIVANGAEYTLRTGPLVVDLAAGTAEIEGEHDTLVGVHEVLGSAGDDLLAGTGGDDVLDGGPGADRLEGRDGADDLDGGSDADRLDGGDGDDSLSSGGDAAGDVLLGGPGRDKVGGGRGPDLVVGGPGEDTLTGERGVDLIDGRDGEQDSDPLQPVGPGQRARSRRRTRLRGGVRRRRPIRSPGRVADRGRRSGGRARPPPRERPRRLLAGRPRRLPRHRHGHGL